MINFSRALALFALCLAACSDSTTAAMDGGTGGDSGGADASRSTADSSTPADASTADAGSAFKGCTDAELAAVTLAANGADVSFSNAGVDGGALAYTNACVRIPAGKDVGLYGDFTVHPLANNGEAGNPIPSKSTGNDSGRITFPTPGKYGFHCTNHPSTMFGTIKVE